MRTTWCILCLSVQIRTACYGSQLVGGVLSRKAESDVSWHRLGKSLLLFSAQLSHCRTVLRLFDDLSMLAYSHSYGMGAGVSYITTLLLLKSTGILCTSSEKNGQELLCIVHSTATFSMKLVQRMCLLRLTGLFFISE